MPSLPDIPGKGLVTGATDRAKALASGAAIGALTLGGAVAKRVLGHRGDDQRPDADPIAETPTAPPGAEEKPVPKPEPAAPKAKAPEKPAKPKVEPKPKPAKAKVDKPKPSKPKADKPKPPKAKAEKPKGKEEKAKATSKPKPPAPTGTDAPAKPEVEPGNISTDREHPHRALNNPVGDPDETEYPDPFEQRSDPRDPVDPDGEPFGEEPHPQVGSESTSEPPPSQDPEVVDGGKPPKREKLDD